MGAAGGALNGCSLIKSKFTHLEQLQVAVGQVEPASLAESRSLAPGARRSPGTLPWRRTLAGRLRQRPAPGGDAATSRRVRVWLGSCSPVWFAPRRQFGHIPEDTRQYCTARVMLEQRRGMTVRFEAGLIPSCRGDPARSTSSAVLVTGRRRCADIVLPGTGGAGPMAEATREQKRPSVAQADRPPTWARTLAERALSSASRRCHCQTVRPQTTTEPGTGASCPIGVRLRCVITLERCRGSLALLPSCGPNSAAISLATRPSRPRRSSMTRCAGRDVRSTADHGGRWSLEFGHDFSQVRVHDDSLANRSASAMGAAAYTVGRDIAFARGMQEPGDLHRRRLLAHELRTSSSRNVAAPSPGLALARQQSGRKMRLGARRPQGRPRTGGKCHRSGLGLRADGRAS